MSEVDYNIWYFICLNSAAFSQPNQMTQYTHCWHWLQLTQLEIYIAFVVFVDIASRVQMHRL